MSQSNRPKIAIEALTPGQVRLFAHVFDKILREYDVHFFTRNFTESVNLIKKYAQKYGFPYVVLGDYPTPNNSNDILKLKLEASIDRMQQLNEFIDFQFTPDAVLTFSSPDMVRVAYGRGIPIINVNDSPHNIPVVNLTFPLSTKTLVPQCVLDDPANQHLQHVTSPERLLSWSGLKELAWIHDFNHPSRQDLVPIKAMLESNRNRNVDTYIVVRLEESYSAYIHDLDSIRHRVRRLLKHLSQYKYTVVIVIVRYLFHRKLLVSIIRELGTNNIIVSPDHQFIDSMVLFSYLLQQQKRIISCFVGSGGTMNTESALLGLPTLSYYPNERISVEKMLQREGLVRPIYESTFFQDMAFVDTVVREWESMVELSQERAQKLIQRLESPCVLLRECIAEMVSR
jgi:predicted glycosyltransferase